MGVQALDHVNIRVNDPEATREFLTTILGMGRSAEQPAWITDEAGRPVLHVGGVGDPYPIDDWRPFRGNRDGGAVHHVALSCADYEAMLARLERAGVDHRTSAYPPMQLRQIFVVEPGGVMLELNFFGS